MSELKTDTDTEVAGKCLSILSDLVKCGIIEHMLITRILVKKYPKMFFVDNQLGPHWLAFLGNSRYQLEEFEIEKGRVYRFEETQLTEDDQEALSMFTEVV